MITKICVKCKKEKDLSEFGNDSHRKDKHRVYCKECSRLDRKIYAELHREEIAKRAAIAYRKNPENKKQYEREHKEEANARKKKYVENNPEKRLEQSRAYYHRNKEVVKLKAKANKGKTNKWRREYNATHPQARIAHNLRTSIGRVIIGKSKGGRLCKLLGCDMDFYKKHLELYFEEGMSWQNYGNGIGKWCIDHIKPLESFDLEDEIEVKAAFHWSNTRPMWYSLNCAKGAKYNGIDYRIHNK